MRRVPSLSFVPLLVVALAAAAFARPVASAPPAAGSARPPQAAPADTIPDTPAGRRLGEIVDVLNAADSAAIRAYVSENLGGRFAAEIPVDRHVQVWLGVARDTGGLEVEEIRDSEPARVRAIVATAGNERLDLVVGVEPEPPHRVVGLGMSPVSPADEVATGGVPDAPLSPAVVADSLGAYVARLADADGFSGVVLMAGPDGEVLLHEAYGEADKAWGIANRPDTKFNLGSMNKMFTAVAIGRLVDRGVLEWDDPIGEWLGEEWVRPEVGETVTIENLLTHTSGLGSYFTPAFLDASRRRFKTLADYAPLVRGDSLAFEPGTSWSYSNTGFLLLGAIVEAATGESYYDFVRENVYEPAGMNDTDAYDLEYPVENLAHGYDPERRGDETRYRDNLFEHVIRGGPAGGGYSTAPDLLAFARALTANRLTSPGTTRRLTTPKPDLGSPEYGYGFQQWDGGAAFGHTGGFPGISSVLRIDRDTGAVLVVMSNYSRGSGPVGERYDRLRDAGR